MDKKSKHRHKCISACVKPGMSLIHPILMIPYVDDDNHFCLTNPFIDDEGKVQYTDICDPLKVSSDLSQVDDEMITIPSISFQCDIFLDLYYNIDSFNEAMKWLSKNKVNSKTSGRILNCSWRIFMPEAKEKKDAVIDFYVNWFKRYLLEREIQSNLNDREMYSVISKSVGALLKKRDTEKFHDALVKLVEPKILSNK